MSEIAGYMRRRWGVISILLAVLLAVGYFAVIAGSRGTSLESRPLISEALPQPAYAQPLPAVRPSTIAKPSASPAPRQPARATPAPPTIHPDAGRADPFEPLIKTQSGESQSGGSQGGYVARTVPLPPPAPLPPPVFPQEVGRPVLPSPSAAPSGATSGAAAAVQSQQMLAAQAQVVGLIGDIVIVRLGDRTYVVRQGERIEGRIQVLQVHAEKGLVVLMENGQRFELQKSEAPSQP